MNVSTRNSSPQQLKPVGLGSVQSESFLATDRLDRVEVRAQALDIAKRLCNPVRDDSYCPDTSLQSAESDCRLLQFWERCPKFVVKETIHKVGDLLTGKTSPKAEPDKPAGFKIGTELPLELEQLQADVETMIESNRPQIQPSLGREHTWSEAGKEYLSKTIWKRALWAVKGESSVPVPTFGTSKLLLMLAIGATSRVAQTGQEQPLKSWILQQPDHSIGINKLFETSYKLNQGNLYQTLMTAENVLSDGWIEPDRHLLPVQQKLDYIRKDSHPAGDNFAAWYHLFGIATYSLMRPEWQANAVQKVESLGSLVLEGKDPQEDLINRQGAEWGQKLRHMACLQSS